MPYKIVSLGLMVTLKLITKHFFSDAATLLMTGDQHMLVMSDNQADLELDQISLRFKTLEPNGLLLAMRDDFSNQRKKDSLEIALSRGGIMIALCLSGSINRALYIKYS